MTFQTPATIPLWDVKWTKAALVKKYEEGPREYRRGFGMDPMSDEERKLPHFERAVENGRGVLVSDIFGRENKPAIFLGGDPGGDKRPGSAFFALGLDKNHRRIPLAIKYGQWGPREFAEQAVYFYRQFFPGFPPAVFYLENDGLQSAYGELIKMLPGAPVLPLKGWLTSNKKTDPEIGIEGMDAEFIQGRWLIPAGEFYVHTVGCACDWCRWRAEVLNYPNHPTSDGLMAMWFAWNALRRADAGGQGEAQSVEGMETGGERYTREAASELEENELDSELESWDI